MQQRENQDLSGKVFGHLTVIQHADDIIHRNAFWSCECKCGAVVYVSGTNLRMGYTTRCRGCAAHDGEK